MNTGGYDAIVSWPGRCTLLTLTASLCLLRTLAQEAGEATPVTVKDEGSGSEREIAVENAFLRVVMEPAHGGRIRSLIDKRTGHDGVHAGNGFLLDMFLRQNYPGELQKAPYEAAVTESGPDRVGVRLRRTANRDGLRGVRVEKTVRLERGARFLTVDYTFANTASDYRSFSYWTQHFCAGGRALENDRYLRPGTRALSDVPFPGGGMYPDALTDPAAGWTACLDPNEKAGTAFLVDYHYLRWLYNAFAAGTVEWVTDQVMLAPGSAWTTTVHVLPLAGFGSLSFASQDLLIHTSVAREDDRLVLTHRLAAVRAPLTGVTLRARARGADGSPAADGNVHIDAIGFTPLEHEQTLALAAAEHEVLLDISTEAEGIRGRYFVSLPDAEGKTDRVAELRPRPPKIKDYPARPGDLALATDDRLDILVIAGPGYSRFNLDRLTAYTPPAAIRWSLYTSRAFVNTSYEGVEYFPSGYPEMAGFDAVIFAGVGPFMLEDFARNMLKDFMEVGGRVLLLGGPTAMNGWTGRGNPLADLFPVTKPGPFAIRKLEPPGAIQPAAAGLESCFAGVAAPVVKYAHALEPAPDVRVLLRTAHGPLLVERKVGQGRLLVFLGTAMGTDEGTSFWNWERWPDLLVGLLAAAPGPAEPGSASRDSAMVLRGLGFSRMRVAEALALVEDFEVELADTAGFRWTRVGYGLSRRPGARAIRRCASYTLFGMHVQSLGSRLPRLVEESIRQGARLCVFGGPNAFGKGAYSGTALEALLPVRCKGPWDTVKFDEPRPFTVSAACRQRFPLDWDPPPTVQYAHDVDLAPEAEVLIRAGEHPILVRRSLGQGNVYAFTGLCYGTDPNGFWAWPQWPQFLALLMRKQGVPRPTGDAANSEIVRYAGDRLPRLPAESATTDWNLTNFQYPAGSCVVEALGQGRKALRIGAADRSQSGRYTANLREGWDTEVPAGTAHAVTVRMAADYPHWNEVHGSGGFGVSLAPHTVCAVDISRFMATDKAARLRVVRRVDGRNEKLDMTDLVRAVIPGWQAGDLHTYRLAWHTPVGDEEIMFDLHVDGRLVAVFPGSVVGRRSDGLHVSFEYGGPKGGTALIESVEWRQTLAE